MTQEESKGGSSENPKVERTQRSAEPYLPAERVSTAFAPVRARKRLDVDAVLARSIRKAAGEESS